ncbi:MAG: transcriptional regulator, IclR family [Paenibacillus sp.]|jgi:DNA-binding IclR family transcriptional regulator|nr:transcriptional regulator, IclR family [Paenibacillus sp.]
MSQVAKDHIYSVQSVERTLLIMETLAVCEDGIRVKELAEQLHLHLSTVHRLVSLLESKGYVEQDPDTKKYFLGLKLLELKGMVTRRLRVVDAAVKEMKSMVADLGQTSHLAVLSDSEVVYLESFEGGESLISRAPVGKRVNIHSTALGKVLTAWLPPEDVYAKLSRREMRKMTPNTIDDPQQFIEHLRLVREQGYASDMQEHHAASCCIAAPIRNYQGTVVAGISVSVTPSHFNEAMQQRIRSRLLETAHYISTKLGSR